MASDAKGGFLFEGSEWTFDTMSRTYEAIQRVAIEDPFEVGILAVGGTLSGHGLIISGVQPAPGSDMLGDAE